MKRKTLPPPHWREQIFLWGNDPSSSNLPYEANSRRRIRRTEKRGDPYDGVAPLSDICDRKWRQVSYKMTIRACHPVLSCWTSITFVTRVTPCIYRHIYTRIILSFSLCSAIFRLGLFPVERRHPRYVCISLNVCSAALVFHLYACSKSRAMPPHGRRRRRRRRHRRRRCHSLFLLTPPPLSAPRPPTLFPVSLSRECVRST